jgi:hypothetical protein
MCSMLRLLLDASGVSHVPTTCWREGWGDLGGGRGPNEYLGQLRGPQSCELEGISGSS